MTSLDDSSTFAGQQTLTEIGVARAKVQSNIDATNARFTSLEIAKIYHIMHLSFLCRCTQGPRWFVGPTTSHLVVIVLAESYCMITLIKHKRRISDWSNSIVLPMEWYFMATVQQYLNHPFSICSLVRWTHQLLSRKFMTTPEPLQRTRQKMSPMSLALSFLTWENGFGEKSG